MNSLKLTFSITHQLFAPGKCFQISSDELGSIWSFGSFANLPRIFRGRKKALHLTTVLGNDTKKLSLEKVFHPSGMAASLARLSEQDNSQPCIYWLLMLEREVNVTTIFKLCFFYPAPYTIILLYGYVVLLSHPANGVKELRQLVSKRNASYPKQKRTS